MGNSTNSTKGSVPFGLTKTLTFLYFALICLVGLSPSKGPSIAARAILCLSLGHTTFVGGYDFASWIATKRKLFLFFLIQLLGWLVLIPVEFYSFEFNNFDTGIFANNIMRWRETGEYYSSILGMHAFADHFTPNLLLFTPLIALWKSFIWLPLAKVGAWAWSIYLLVILSHDVLGRKSPYRYIVPGIYLLNQFVANAMLMEFQPSSLAIPCIILAFRLAYHERIIPLVAVLIGILGFKEHLGVVWISIGSFLILERHRTRLGLLLITFGIVEGFLIYKWLMPVFAKGVVHHDARIAPFSGLFRKVILIIKAVFSFGGLPLFARYGLLYALPGFVLVLMGGDPGMQSFDHHYHDVGFALLACSSILGLRSVRDRIFTDQITPQRIINCVVLVILAQAVRFPTFYIRREWPSHEMLAAHRDLSRVKSYIAEHSPLEIWTLDHLGPYFFDQLNLKSISQPELPPLSLSSAPRLIVLSPIVKTYPLWGREYQLLLTRLNAHYRDVTAALGITSPLQVFLAVQQDQSAPSSSGKALE